MNKTKPLQWHHFSAYGLASIGKVSVEMLLQLYLFDFYTRLLGLSPILAGSAFAIAIVWDAISDVIVSTGLMYARRKKILYTSVILFGSVILGFSSHTLFSVGAEMGQLRLFLQLLMAYVLVNTGMTLIDLPQTSLSSELSPNSDERNKLLGFRLGMSILGLMIGSALPGILLENESNGATLNSRTESATIIALIVFFSSSLTALGLRSRDRLSTEMRKVDIPNLSEALAVLDHPAFRKILYASAIAAIGRTINSALALSYYRLVLNMSEQTVTQKIFPVFTISIVLSIPLWTWLSKLYGKVRPAWVSLGLLGLLGIIAYPILPEQTVWPVLIISVIGGVFCGAVFLVDSMITDLIDWDEMATGKRKEALFFAVQKSAVKISRAIAFILVGSGLEIFGINISDDFADASERWIIICLFGFFVGLCFIFGSYFLRQTEKSFNETKN